MDCMDSSSSGWFLSLIVLLAPLAACLRMFFMREENDTDKAVRVEVEPTRFTHWSGDRRRRLQ